MSEEVRPQVVSPFSVRFSRRRRFVSPTVRVTPPGSVPKRPVETDARFSGDPFENVFRISFPYTGNPRTTPERKTDHKRNASGPLSPGCHPESEARRAVPAKSALAERRAGGVVSVFERGGKMFDRPEKLKKKNS